MAIQREVPLLNRKRAIQAGSGFVAAIAVIAAMWIKFDPLATSGDPQSQVLPGEPFCEFGWAEGPGRVAFPEPEAAAPAVALQASAVQPSPDEPLFRVTSGFFTREDLLGITNAGHQEILLFGRDGAVERRIGGQGSGPSEFLQLYFAHLGAGSETILAFDNGHSAAKEFSSDGELLRMTKLQLDFPLRVFRVLPLPDHRTLVLPSWGTTREQTARTGSFGRQVPLVAFDSSGANPRVLAQLRGMELLILSSPRGGFSQGPPPFERRPWLAVDALGCILHPMDEGPGLVVRDTGGAVRLEVNLPFIDTRTDEAAWNARLSSSAERGYDVSDLEPPPHVPAWSNGVFDGQSKVWLEAYHHRDEHASGWWIVDLATGKTTHAAAPPGADLLLAVTPTRAAIRMRDSLDTESVMVFDISGGYN